MSAPQNNNNCMWVYNFEKQKMENLGSPMLMNNVYEITKAAELVKFLHTAAEFLVTDT